MRAGPYELGEEIGAGASGRVFRARHALTGREAAVKLVALAAGREDEATERRERFQREASAWSALQHPNIVTIFEIGQESGTAFLAMELLAGSLHERLKRGPLPEREALELVGKVARAVAHAHAAGVIHRDVKPGNILLTREGEPRLGDFGLARRTEDVRLTQTGAVLGTPAYLSPEQTRSEEPAPASDIWALGVVLFECLAGRQPFESTSLIGLTVKIQAGVVPPLAASPEACAIVARALALDPAKRWPTAAELALACEHATRASAPGPGARASRWRSRRPIFVGAALVVLAVAAVLGARRWRQARDADARSRDLAAADRCVAAGESALDEARSLAARGAARERIVEKLAAARRAAGLAAAGLATDEARERARRGEEALLLGGGELLLRSKAASAAREWFETAASRSPPGFAAIDGVHRCDHAEGRSCDRTRERLMKVARALHVENGYTLAEEAEEANGRSDFAGALALCERAFVYSHEIAGVWRQYATAQGCLGRLDKAIEGYDRSLALDPFDRLDRKNRAKCLRGTGERARAIRDLDALLADGPPDLEALVVRGEIQLSLGELAKAQADFKAATELAPERSEGWTDLAIVELRLGHGQVALEAADRSLALLRTALACYARAAALTLLGRTREALPTLEEAVGLEPNAPMSHWKLGWCHFLLGDTVHATEEARKSRELCTAQGVPLPPELEDLMRRLGL